MKTDRFAPAQWYAEHLRYGRSIPKSIRAAYDAEFLKKDQVKKDPAPSQTATDCDG